MNYAKATAGDVPPVDFGRPIVYRGAAESTRTYTLYASVSFEPLLQISPNVLCVYVTHGRGFCY